MKMLEVAGKRYETDAEGFLLRMDDWSEALCEQMARDDHCELNDDHRCVIRLLREFYREYKISPATRVLLKAMRETLGEDKANSQYLYTLFPYGPSRQACRYAGLPKPTNCI